MNGKFENIVPNFRKHRISGIYLFRNKKNGKVYIGQSNDLYMRYYRHKRSEKHPITGNSSLIQAFKKYGFNCFEYSILEFVERDKLIVREQYWMDYFKSYQKEFGYNLCPAAGSPMGYKHSEETKRKVSLAGIGRKHSVETRNLLSKIHTGKIISAESRHKNRLAHLGKKVPNKRGRIIAQISKVNGEVLKIFRSASAAAIATNQKSCSAILENCKGTRISAGGYLWRFHV